MVDDERGFAAPIRVFNTRLPTRFRGDPRRALGFDRI
jgi:hypothetical protein